MKKNRTPPKMDAIMTIDEISGLLYVHGNTVRGWIREGRLKGFKVGRLWRVKRDEFDLFIRMREG